MIPSIAIEQLLKGLSLFPPAFERAFSHLIHREGYFANVRGDRGGMTYCGIARNFWGKLTLWLLIDEYVDRLGRPLRWNERIPSATIEARVKAFYFQKFWTPLRADDINSTSVAEFLFDSYVHSGSKAIQWLQQAASEVGAIKLTVDRRIGPKTIAAVNACDPQRLFYAMQDRRAAYLNWLADNVAGQGKFKRGWMRRINEFSYEA